ncbi:hypothetical protein J3Q64DRAFT_1634015 [Phycomyces blakesleeanus]
MKSLSLTQKLQGISQDYDYGIVPGSSTIFMRDEVNGIARLDLTLLEGVMVIIEVCDQGYKLCSYISLSATPSAFQAGEAIKEHVEVPFESMDNLLMTISPAFRERLERVLFDKLQDIHSDPSLPVTHSPTPHSSSSTKLQDSFDDINDWIH